MSSFDLPAYINYVVQSEHYVWHSWAGLKFLQGFFSLALGLFVFFKNPRGSIHRSYLVFAVCIFFWLTGLALAWVTVNPELHILYNRIITHMGVCFIGPSVVWVTCELLGVAVQKRRFILLNFGLGVLFYLLFQIFPTIFFPTKTLTYDWGIYVDIRGTFYPLFYIPFVLQLAFGAYHFRKAMIEARSPAERNKFKYMLSAFLIIYVGSIDWLAGFGFDLKPIGHFFALGFDLLVAYAILSEKLFDIETVFLKSAVVAITGVLMFAPLGWLISEHRKFFESLPTEGLLLIIFAGVTFIILNSRKLHDYIENVIDGHRKKLEAEFSQIVKDLSVLTSREKISDYIAQKIKSTVDARSVNLYLSIDLKCKIFCGNLKENDTLVTDEGSFVKALLSSKHFLSIHASNVSALTFPDKSIIYFPFSTSGSLVGFMGLGLKSTGHYYKRAELDFLIQFCQIASLAVKNALLFEKSIEVERAKMASLCEMAGGIAHDVNNPLMIIRGVIDKLNYLNSTNKQSDLHDVLPEENQKVTAAVERIASLVSALQTVSQNKSSVESESVEVSSLVKETLASFHDKLEQAGIELKEIYPPNSLFVSCQQRDVRTALSYIIQNSIDALASLESKWIEVKCMEWDNKVRISVTDSGKGIPDIFSHKIMDPFFTTKGVGKGRGLGLSLSKSLIERFHGTISLDRSSEYTRFVIDLPLEQIASESTA